MLASRVFSSSPFPFSSSPRTGGCRLHGGSAPDTLRGGRGFDFLNGGRGADLLHGGTNSDTYQLSPGRDTIRGFTPGEDVIQASVVPELVQQQRHVLLSYPKGQTLLLNVDLDDVKMWLTMESGGLDLVV